MLLRPTSTFPGQLQGLSQVPGSGLGVEIADLNLSPLSSLSPSVWICTSTSSCLFYLTLGRRGSAGRSDARHPTFPLLFDSSVSRALSHHVSTLCSGWEKTPGGGWGPGSDFMELGISLLGIQIVSPFPRLLFHSIPSSF